MAKVNGKSKGNSFERAIANKLSDRFADYLGIPKGFRRNPDSGSFFGGSNVERTQTYDTDYAIYGDLICPRAFKYSIECKNYKTAPSYAAILNNKITEWDKWIAQAEQDANASGKKMMLIVKYNRSPEIVIVSDSEKDPVLMYKNKYRVFLLDDFLSQDDSNFFE